MSLFSRLELTLARLHALHLAALRCNDVAAADLLEEQLDEALQALRQLCDEVVQRGAR